MQELEWMIPEGSLSYVRQGGKIEITRYQGLAGHVKVPESLEVETEGRVLVKQEDDLPVLTVKSIAKKAFLSKKFLRSVEIPASVEEVGDWAFAYCDSLREVSFAGRNVTFGKAVFLECPALRCIRFADRPSGELGGAMGDKASGEGIGALLAAAVTQMESPYLLNAKEAGSREWLEKWDARMMAILSAEDDEGYSKQILCGEEDYESADLETYLSNSRKKKVRLLLLRLLWPMELEEGKEKQLRAYLLAHTKGCETEETWQVVRDEYGERREFYELFASLGCLTKENAPGIIAQTREENPEMKAFFLKYQADHFSDNNFFGDLAL